MDRSVPGGEGLMAKRQKKDSSVETAVLENLARSKSKAFALTRFTCGHVGAEIGVKAKAFVRWAEVRSHLVEDDLKKKCPDCK